jgi:hypothetical protein
MRDLAPALIAELRRHGVTGAVSPDILEFSVQGPDRLGKREGIVTLTGAMRSLGGSEPRSGRRARALPNLERCGSKLFVHGPFEEVALVIEAVVGRGVDVEETLR